MHKGNAALTRWEVLTLSIILALIILGFLMPTFERYRESSRREACRDNLRQLGIAMTVYRDHYDNYFPFSWMPANAQAPRKKDAMTSIACLYPEYLGTARIFRCPSTQHKPSFVFNASSTSSAMDENALPDEGTVLRDGNYTLIESSYGYDCRLSPRAVSGHAIMADMDGSYDPNRDTHTANHAEVQNVLYADGGVRWVSSNFCSDNPHDNIFSEGALDITGPYFWHADTDSFISDNTPTFWDSAPDAFNDLSASYDGYPDLHP